MSKKIVYAFLFCLAFENVAADVYMDIGSSLNSTVELFGANGNTGQERYIILNGVPITFTKSNTNLSHLEAIDEVYKFKMQEHTSVQTVADSKKWGDESEPIVIINDEWSAIFKINSKEMFDSNSKVQFEATNNTLNQNYIIFARNSINNKSIVHELKFNQAMDIFKMFLSENEDVDCDVKTTVDRYPSSRRTFCITELTNEKIISQVVIYEGYGIPSVRISHYQKELESQNYHLEAVNTSSHDRSILFAKNDITNITVFTYKSQNKVLDILQSQY